MILAGAGAAYLSGGFGSLEFAFCGAITVLAYKGLDSYRANAVGWVMRAGWDVAQHMYGNSIIPFAPLSSVGRVICDPGLATWYAFGAPSFRGERPAKPAT